MVDEGLSGILAQLRQGTLESSNGIGSLYKRFTADVNETAGRGIRRGIRRLAKLGFFSIAFMLVLPTLLMMSFLAIFVALLFGLPLFGVSDFDILALKGNPGGRFRPRDSKKSVRSVRPTRRH